MQAQPHYPCPVNPYTENIISNNTQYISVAICVYICMYVGVYVCVCTYNNIHEAIASYTYVATYV